ncbi:MAG: methyltransferase domain-containing protein [Bacillaceae bacterium]|nr:methyltransferase domain-containing protein [Bacillaceae bacterium]
MSQQDRDKWNRKYREKLKREPSFDPEPNPTLVELSTELTGGKALDIACGLGGNSLFLARLGYEVTALDVSEVAIDYVRELADREGLSIHPERVDLEQVSLPEETFDLVVDTYYLDRGVLQSAQQGVKPGGLFFMETFLKTNVGGKDGHAPVRDAFKLNPGELREIFKGWEMKLYREDEEAGTVSMLAVKKG